MLGNGLWRDYMGCYILQDWLKIKQLVAVLQLWFCGKSHLVVLDLNYVFVQDHALWHQKDPKKQSRRHFKFVLQIQRKGRQMSPKRKSLGIIFVSVWVGWNSNESTNEESEAMLLTKLFFKKKKKKNRKKKTKTHWWLCCSWNFTQDSNSLNDKKDGYNQISRSSHKNSC